MEDILLPTTVEFIEGDNVNVGKVVITPCHQGYGTTLGNALRRVLLSSLPGSAVEAVKISGVVHEFSAIEGVQEDMIAVILNLKNLAIRSYSSEPITLSLTKKGKGVVTAKDFGKNADVEIVNPELELFTITSDSAKVDMEIIVGSGRGYKSVEEKNSKNLDLGTILIDSLYSPIRDIGYNVELTRVGDVTDYEKLTLSIETNGTITPREAVSQATKILMDHFALLLDVAEVENKKVVASEEVENTTEEANEKTEAEEEVKEKKTAKKKVAKKKTTK